MKGYSLKSTEFITEEEANKRSNPPSNDMGQPNTKVELPVNKEEPVGDQPGKPNAGSLIMDATACPQEIACLTDLNLLNDSREKSEELIDILHTVLSIPGPRTYREIARNRYLSTAQKKKKTKREITNAIRRQLQ